MIQIEDEFARAIVHALKDSEEMARALKRPLMNSRLYRVRLRLHEVMQTPVPDEPKPKKTRKARKSPDRPRIEPEPASVAEDLF